MAIQIGAAPDSGFDNPIGMLKDCHRRIERFLHILCTVADSEGKLTVTGEEQAAVESALRYFRQGGKRHTADEEESLFPRLRAESSPAEIKMIGGLESDHRNANDLHEIADRFYSAWIADRSLSAEDRQRLHSATTQLKHLYEEHIQVEEKIVFPRATEVLDSRTIAIIGSELRARRERSIGDAD